MYYARRKTTEGNMQASWLTWRDANGHVHRHDGIQRRSHRKAVTPPSTLRVKDRPVHRYPQLRHEMAHRHG